MSALLRESNFSNSVLVIVITQS